MILMYHRWVTTPTFCRRSGHGAATIQRETEIHCLFFIFDTVLTQFFHKKVNFVL